MFTPLALALSLAPSTFPVQITVLGPPEEITTAATRIDEVSVLAVGDTDSDGHPDIAAHEYPVLSTAILDFFICTQPTLGRLNEPQASSVTPGRVSRSQIVDVDGDGRDDVISWTRLDDVVLSLQLLDGTLAAPVAIGRLEVGSFALFRPRFDMGPALVDVDADGDLDLIGFLRNSGSAPDELVIYDQLTPGVFSQAPRTVALLLYNLVELTVADFDDDGLDDVLISAADPAGTRWLRNTGTGDLLDQGSLFPFFTLDRFRFQPVDVDGDGISDLTYADTGSGTLKVRPGLGGGVFDPTPVSLTGITAGVRNYEFADLNFDGHLDLLIIGSFPATELRLAIGRPGFAVAQPQVDPGPYASMVVADMDLDGDLDVVLGDPFDGSIAIRRSVHYGSVGTQECSPAAINSTGESARIEAVGSSVPAMDRMELRAFRLPSESFGFFLCSQVAGSVPGVGGGAGTLCLGGDIGRFVGPGEIQQAGDAGQARLDITPSSLPQPNGPVAAVVGSTWRFQGWYRDTSLGQVTSNLTDAVAVTFTAVP